MRADPGSRPKAQAKTARKPTLPMVIKLPDWPDGDRQLWEAGQWLNTKPRKSGFGSKLQPVSIRNAMKSYGRYLAALRDAGDLHAMDAPAERVIPHRVSGFVTALREKGNKGNTIKVRLMEISTAMRIMQPATDLTWLTRPGGYSLDFLLPQEPQDFPIIPSPVLYRWGLELMDEASADEVMSFECDREFRDGLIIAILACRAPRLRTLAGIRIGQQLKKIGEEFWLCFAKTDVKNRKAIEYSLPENLTSYIQEYLDEVRPRMLGLVRTDWLWVIEQHAPFKDIGIAKMIERRSLQRFGHAFGPHRFRHYLATTLAEEDPKNPGLAAALLGVTEAVVAEHYRRVKQIRVAIQLQKQLADERDRTRLLAEREMNRGVLEPAD